MKATAKRFIKRIEKFVNARGRTLVGWSKFPGGLATDAVVMDWIGEQGSGERGARRGHDAAQLLLPQLLSIHQFCREPPGPRGRFTSLEKVYRSNRFPPSLPAQFDSHILGAQGNLWTEWIASFSNAEYRLFPRLCALAEVVWSPKDTQIGLISNGDSKCRRNDSVSLA